MRTRLRPYLPATLVLVMLQAVSAAQVRSLPDRAVGEDTFAAIHIDLQSLTPELLQATLDAVYDVIPRTASTRQIRLNASALRDEVVSRYVSFRAPIREAGGRDVWLLLHAYGPRLLIHAANDQGHVSAAARWITPGLDPVALGDGWHLLDPLFDADAIGPRQTDADRFSQAVRSAPPAPVRAVVTFTPSMRAMAAGGMAKGMFDDAGPLRWPVEKFRYMTAALKVGDTPTIRFTTHFDDAEAAQAYLEWSGNMLRFAGSMTKRNIATAPPEAVPHLPEPEAIDAIVAALRETRQGTATTLTIGVEQIRVFAQLTPLIGFAMDPLEEAAEPDGR